MNKYTFFKSDKIFKRKHVSNTTSPGYMFQSKVTLHDKVCNLSKTKYLNSQTLIPTKNVAKSRKKRKLLMKINMKSKIKYILGEN